MHPPEDESASSSSDEDDSSSSSSDEDDSSSSSSDEDDSSSSEEEEEENEDEDEDEDEDDEDDTPEREPNDTTVNQPVTPSVPQRERTHTVRSVPQPDSSSEDEDDEEDTPEQEREPNDTIMVRDQLGPPSVPQRERMDTVAKAVPVRKDDSSSKKRPSDKNQVSGSGKRKRVDDQITTETKKLSSVNKVWSTEDEKNLISCFHEFVLKNSGSRKDIGGFFEIWNARVGKFGKKQVEDKLRRLRDRYLLRQNMENIGESSKNFAGPIERDIYVLSKEIWGAKEVQTYEGDKMNRAGSDKEKNKKNRKEEAEAAKENSKVVKENSEKKKGKVKADKMDVHSPETTITVAEKEEDGEKEQMRKKNVKQPKSDAKIHEKPGEAVMRSWSMLIDKINKPVGFDEALGVNVMSLRELKETGLEAPERKLNQMRSEIEEKQAEITCKRLGLVVELIEAARSAREKAKEQ